MSKERLNWWLTVIANLAVLGGLVFVGFEIRQNTQQLRLDAAHAVTASVNELNAAIMADPELTELVLRGEADLASLSDVERNRFDRYQFSRLNIAEYMRELEAEGIGDTNFQYDDAVVRFFQTRPGLQQFITEYADGYAGSEALLAELLDRAPPPN